MKKFVSTARIGVICLTILMTLGFSYTPIYAMSSAALTNVEMMFIVYPEGTVELLGRGNSTIENPSMGNSTIELNVKCGRSGDQYNVLSDFTFTIPPENATAFPFNATTATLNIKCENNVTTTTLDASLKLCDSFGGMSFKSFPFNSTDLLITGSYAEQRFNGTITIHLIPGLTLGNIHVNFEGNLTHVVLSDSIRVYYNCTMPIEFPELNATSIHWFLEWFNSTIPGTAEGSLYDMTGGMLICTTFNTTLTPIDNNCADVGLFVVVKAAEGDFIQLLSNILKSGGISIPYMGDPYPLINAAVYSVINASFSMSYYKSSKTINFNSNLVQNFTEWQKMYSEVLIGMPQLQPHIQSLLNTTYTSIYSFTEKIAYSNGKVTYNGNYLFTGDLNAQVNHAKNVYVDMINATMPEPEWLINTIKSTDINITNLWFNLKMNSTFQQLSFSGLKFVPPVNYINSTAFKLEDFFNVTTAMFGGDPEPPRFNETLKLVVQGGGNGTHTVTVHFNPEEVPEPDEFLNENTLVWNNQSISKLKHLIFQVWDGKAEKVYNPTLITPTTPYTINATREALCILSINHLSKSVIINIKNATLPDAPLPKAYNFSGICVQILSTEDVIINATLRIYYSPEQLSKLGLDELSLKIFYFNVTSNQWEEMKTTLNTSEYYVETTISHLSLWALFAEPIIPIWQEWWFQATIAVIAIAVIVAAALFIVKKKAEKAKP